MSKRIDAKQHMDLALRYLEEGRSLADKDPVQASEKLYKAAEETVKMLAISFNMEDILKTVDERGRWKVTELEKTVSRISKKIGD
jgi:rRNA processing protein Krr1/Pno1